MRAYLRRGYAIHEGVLSSAECNTILAGFNPSGRAGSRNLLRSKAVETLAHDTRLVSIAGRFIGSDPVPYKAILFDKSPDSNWLVVWHQDRVLPLKRRFVNPEWGPWTVKNGVHYAQAPAWAMQRVIALRINLDNSNAENGPLRLLPGSHSLGVLEQKEVIDRAAKHKAVTVTTPKGGVIAMRPLIIHSSSKTSSDEPRRVLHIEYTGDLCLSEGIDLAIS